MIGKKYFLVFTALLVFSCRISFAGGKLIPLKDSPDKNGEYTSILTFRIKYIDKSNVNAKNFIKGRVETFMAFKLRYFDGLKLMEVPATIPGNWDYKEKICYCSGVVFIAAKPGKYDLLDLFYKTSGSTSVGGWTSTTTITNSYPINSVLELKAGNVYYAGDVNIDVAENKTEKWNLFINSISSDSIVSDFKKKYPNTFSVYKNNFAPVVFSEPTPLQAQKVIFSSQFTKSEGLWKESNDSLHTASFEEGHYRIESKSDCNMGTEIIELPEKLGKSVDIELRIKWISGTNKSGFGLILPGRYSGALSAKCPQGEIEPRGYVFGISPNGYAGIWYECLLRFYEGNKNVKKMTTLTDWKNIPTIKTNSNDQNTIHIQVIGQVIAYYVNDKFVSRAPFNSLAKLNAGEYLNYQNILEFTEFLNEDFKLLGIYSYKKQTIEFDELKVSRFK